jgi:glycosyltransferase involved in cell wall biosynthesis
MLLPSLASALQADGWKCVAVGGSELARSIGWEAQPWSEAVERSLLSRASVGVMPQFNDGWSERKAAYKLLEYAASGVLPVASDVTPARAILDRPPLSSLLVPDDLTSWLRAANDAFDRRGELSDALDDIVVRFSAATSAELWERAVGVGS